MPNPSTPTPLRLIGFIASVGAGALIALGSLLDWAKVAVAGSTASSIGTKGVDIWEGKLALIGGFAILIAFVALRTISSRRRRWIVSLGIVVIAILSGLAAASVIPRADTVFQTVAVNDIARKISAVSGIPFELERQHVIAAVRKSGIFVSYQLGFFLVLGGAVLGVAAGVADLLWVREGETVS